jgi:ABC-type sugar transport system ATPase subunit
LIGAGRTEVAHAIFGSSRRMSGTVRLDGREMTANDPRASIDAGIGFLTEDRKGEGLLMLLDVAANMSAPMLGGRAGLGSLDRSGEIAVAAAGIARYRIAVPGPTHGVRALSGGNQQKILFARWAASGHRVLILDEPTRGVDVGAKVEIYRIIRQLAEQGVAVLVISSELPEVVGLCDRVIVMREGAIAGEVSGARLNEADIMRLATGSLAATEQRLAS